MHFCMTRMNGWRTSMWSPMWRSGRHDRRGGKASGRAGRGVSGYCVQHRHQCGDVRQVVYSPGQRCSDLQLTVSKEQNEPGRLNLIGNLYKFSLLRCQKGAGVFYGLSRQKLHPCVFIVGLWFAFSQLYTGYFTEFTRKNLWETFTKTDVPVCWMILFYLLIGYRNVINNKN